MKFKKTIMASLMLLSIATFSSCEKKEEKTIDNKTKNALSEETADKKDDKKTEEKNDILQVGKNTVYFELEDLNEKKKTPDDFKGKTTFYTFFTTNCHFCAEEIKEFKGLDKDKLNIVLINIADTPNDIKEYVKQHEIDFPVLSDRTGEIAQKYRVFGTPNTAVIDKDGKYLGTIQGYSDLETIKKTISEIEKSSNN